MTPTAAANRGSLIKSIGVGWIVEFPSVFDAFVCAQFEGDKISHMTEIRNDVHALRGLGWA